MNISIQIIDSPVGKLRLAASDEGLHAVLWDHKNLDIHPLYAGKVTDNHPILRETARQLNEYFEKKRKSFSLPLNFTGTPFQKNVWKALLTIPYGETRSYGEIARQIGSSDAVRVVGASCGSNPIVIVAPCHRVIGANGKLTGFGGGLENKAFLLSLEGAKRRSADADQTSLEF